MLIIDGYSINELIQQNGKFSIYRGIRKADQKNVILKVCQSEHTNLSDIVSLQHEYQILKQLNLACIIQVYELIKLQNRLILVLEDIDGISLRRFLANGPVNLATFFKLAIQLVDAIGELHLQHIIHKEINPDNILINTKNLNIKLADFSVSSDLFQQNEENHSNINLERPLAYISPEQTGRINRSIDYRSDFYSLGIILYEMLTGLIPFDSDDPMELIHFHLTFTPASLASINPDIPPVVEEIINKLLSKTPEKRYQSAAGLKSDLLLCQQQWEANKKINHFSVGQNDLQDRFIVSQKLYGREEQLDTLLDKFNNVSHGRTELVFVSGYSGIGKTSLVNELHRPILRQRGYFLSGKFDQLQRSTPYSAIIEAFSAFVRLCLTEPETQLSILRSSLISALGSNGQVIIDIIPDIELIIGKQPPVPDLSPAEAQNRLTATFLDFVRKLIEFKHPLVLFLDDLQWIDTASLKLLQLLIDDEELHHMLIIGAYRDNEVLSNHPLVLMQRDLSKNSIQFTNLVLSQLKDNDIRQLIADSLATDQDELPELVNLIMFKTQGNPFFINEFLKKLYHENLLKYSHHERNWKWNINQIEELSITDNVIDLLIARIDELPIQTQNLLELASCIGHTFDLVTLSTICELDLSETARSMLEAIKASFIIPVNGNSHLLEVISAGITETSPLLQDSKYRFIHDKIQQASYQMIPDEKKQQMHLRIGRLLLKGKNIHEKDDQLFEILNHFNCGLDEIHDKDEILELSRYNLWAGRKAKMSSAYQSAKEYINFGLKLLDQIDPGLNHELRFALTKELATCQYLTGEYENAEYHFNQLLLSAKESLSTIEIYKLKCEMLSTLNRHEEAIQLGLKVLASVNVHIPRRPTLLHILWAIFKIKFLIGGRNIEEINFKLMESKENQAVAELISQLFNSAFVTNQDLFTLLVCTSVQFSLRHGYTNCTGFSCVVYAFVVMHGLNWHKEGLAFNSLYQKLCNQYTQVNFEGKNKFVIGAFIDPWRLPLRQSIDVLREGYQHLYDTGDLVYSNYSNLIMFYHSFMIGNPISETKVYLQNTINFIKKVKARDFNILSDFWNYIIQSLTEDEFEVIKIYKYEKDILECNNNTEISFFYCMATKICFLFGYYKEAIYCGKRYEHYARYTLGLISSVDGYFYYSMSILCAANNINYEYSWTLKSTHRRLMRWASWTTDNYQPYLLLFEAEMERVNKDMASAMQKYTHAIKLFESQNTFNMVALGNELLGRFYTELSSPEVAQLYYNNAYSAYMHIGYTAKANALCEQLADSFPIPDASISTKRDYSNDSDNSLASIDMISLMKSSQAISSEIELDKLLYKLLIILLQNAGAHRVLLLSRENDNWYVEAEGTASEQRISLSHVDAFDYRTDLPLTLIRYVQRVQKPALLQTHKELENYAANDEYIRMTQPQSVLVIPVFFHGNLQSILYLENRTVSMAFKNEHVHILQILSSQAAISLQNARLYHQATHDSLTGLSNRNLLYQLFNLLVKKIQLTGTSIALLLIDLDYFKIINDTLGHHVGDKVLLHVATLLRQSLEKDSLAARLGGDEFVVIIEYQNLKEITAIADKILHNVIEPINIDGHEMNLTTSIGISLYPHDGDNISELLKQADMALYRVKTRGKNQFQFYTASLQNQIKQEYLHEIELRAALENKEFCIYYQPVYSARNHKATYFEALLRWNHPENGITAAKHFIPLAEKTGLIIPLGRWVLKAVLEQINLWKSLGIKPIPIAVNVSALQFKMQTVNEIVHELLDKTNVDVSYLELEFTESASIEYTEKVLDDISKLKLLGVKLTLDDFGTYYSSLTYLRQNIVDKIKIDQSFVKDLHGNASDRELIIAIINLAHSLNLNVVAEGVENETQLDFLISNGIDEIQGFYLSQPISADECNELLISQEKELVQT